MLLRCRVRGNRGHKTV